MHPLCNTEMTKYSNYDPRSNAVFWRDDLSRIKDGAYVINPNSKQSKKIHWVSLFIDKNIAMCF